MQEISIYLLFEHVLEIHNIVLCLVTDIDLKKTIYWYLKGFGNEIYLSDIKVLIFKSSFYFR